MHQSPQIGGNKS